MSEYFAIYQDFFSCFLLIIKTNSPRQITYTTCQQISRKKNDAWELENELLGHLGPESRMTQCELESQDVCAFSKK